MEYHHIWKVKKFMPEYFNKPCQLIPLKNGKKAHKGKVIVQFEDGKRVRTSINYIRKRKDENGYTL